MGSQGEANRWRETFGFEALSTSPRKHNRVNQFGLLMNPIKSFQSLRAAFRAWRKRRRAWRKDPERHIANALEGLAAVSAVQIGSNDGSTGDPVNNLILRNPGWTGLFVEPVPFLFERLRKNYPSEARLRFENVAISDKVGSLPFYYLSPEAGRVNPDLPEWFDQLGSFDREHIASKFGNSMDQFIVEAMIPTVSLEAVLKRNGVEKVDLLHIDTEGHDWVILKQFDLPRFRPRVILFEHKHLREQDKKRACDFLGKEYRIKNLGADYFCERIV